MTSQRRGQLEKAGFGALLMMTLGLFWLRVSRIGWGLSAEQSESLALAKSFAAGLGLRFTASSSSAEGPPNLIWLFVQTLVWKSGGDPATWLPRVATVLIALSLVVVSFRGAMVWRRAPRLEDALPALGLAGATAMAEAAALGSGASLWVLMLSMSAVLLGRSLGSGSSRVTGVLIGALTVFRPSAVWLLAASVPAWWISSKLEGRKAWRETFIFLIGGAVAVALVFGARLLLIGALPLEGVFPSGVGRALTVEFLERQERWFWAALAGVLMASVWRRFHLRGGGTVMTWVLMTVVLATWTSNARSLFLGCVPLLAMLVGEGLSAARDEAALAHDERPLRRLAWLGLCGGVVLLGLASLTSFHLGPIMNRRIEPVLRPLINEELHRRAIRQPFIAWSDGAEAAMLFPEARVVVVREGDAALDDLLLSEGPPDFVDARVQPETLPRVMAVLVAGPGDARWLAQESSDDDPRCPDGRMALVASTPELLADQLAQDVMDAEFQRGLSRWRCAVAALEPAALVADEKRAELASNALEQSKAFEARGELEQAVRAGSLAAELSHEDVRTRAAIERLRRKWLARSVP